MEDFCLVVMARKGAKTRHKYKSKTTTAEQSVRDIRRKTRKQYSSEADIRIIPEVLDGKENHDHETQGNGNIHERSFGTFRRAFRLPADAKSPTKSGQSMPRAP